MIDNFEHVQALMKKLESALPIPAQAAGALVHSLRDRGIKLPSKNVMIDKLLYLGDEGGIACSITIPGHNSNPMIVSITHLSVSKTHPLASDVRKYQIARTRKLS